MGTVVISVDAELGWNGHDHDRPPAKVEDARDGWRFVCDLFDTFDLPATWAVAGHLLLDECDGRHEDHPLGPSWFARERTTWADRPDLRFADGLIERVLESSPAHEIGCLGFSNVDFGAPETSTETARAELQAASDAARRRGLDLSSFVFPHNRVGHRGELAAAGFDCYRGVVPGQAGRHRKLVDAMVGTPAPRLVTPAVDDWGLVNIPASLYLFAFDGVARTLLEPAFGDPIRTRVEQGLDALADSEQVFHIWLRPSNIRKTRDRQRLREVCASIDQRRGHVDVATMGTVTARTTRTRRNRQVGELR
mgnify:FL=1